LFFRAEDGIRDATVTGVQTCALPISRDRLAIQTVVAPFQEDLVQSAIETELARDGQVFFIHNRVESIYSLGAMVQKLVPKARVEIGRASCRERGESAAGGQCTTRAGR